MSVRACVFGFVVLMAAPTGAGERLALKVSPAVAFAPANLIVRTTVEADAGNRAMEVVAEASTARDASINPVPVKLLSTTSTPAPPVSARMRSANSVLRES